MLKRLITTLAASIVLSVGMAPTAVAQEDTRVVLRPGDGITFSTADVSQTGWCSIAAVGRDNAGRLIGITAGHCVNNQYVGTNNKPVYKVGSQSVVIARTTPVFQPGSLDWFGLFVTNTKPDYAALVLDETKVRYEPTSAVDAEGQSVTITGTRRFTSTGRFNIGSVCHAGYTTKVRCSAPTDGIIVRSNLINAYPKFEAGDSGGALVDNTGKLIGVLTGFTADYPANASTRMDVIVADMNAKGSYGAGWTPIVG